MYLWMVKDLGFYYVIVAWNVLKNLEEREDIFKRYWGLGHWHWSLSIFIVNNIKLLPIKSRTTNVPNSRKWHRKMYLNRKRICKETFLSTLGISSGRINYALNRKSKGGTISPDRRGGNPVNKTPQTTILKINHFLNKFPKFKSHYSKSEKTYFHPELTTSYTICFWMSLKMNLIQNLNCHIKFFLNVFYLSMLKYISFEKTHANFVTVRNSRSKQQHLVASQKR